MSILRASIVALFTVGCAANSGMMTGDDTTDPNALLPGFDLPAAPTADVGMRFITPPTKGLEPGMSHEICAWTGVSFDHDVDLRKAAGYQMTAGHHIILFASKLNLPAGTSRECTDADMASFRQVAATGAEGLPSEAPGDLVYRIDAGMYVVLQEHYINATDDTLDSQSALDIFYAPAGGNYTPSHSIAFLNTQLDLPPGASSIDVHCTMQDPIDGWFSIPHMHQWGTMFNSSITSNGVVTKMWDNLAWNPNYMFSPPTKEWDITAPMHLLKGDDVDVHCEWNNDTSSDLHFGQEMCVFYMQTIDAQDKGNIDCDNGAWGSF
jgi:hypothetical protein